MRKDLYGFLQRYAGAVSFLGTYLLFLFLALKLGTLGLVAREFVGLFHHGPDFFAGPPVPFASGLTRIPAMLALLIPVGLIVGFVTRWRFLTVDKVTYSGFAQASRDSATPKEAYLALPIAVVLIEEIVARAFLLGVAAPQPRFASPHMFAVLVVAGIAFAGGLRIAVVSLLKRPCGSWLTVVVPALLSTYLYVRGGFLVALVAHLAYDALLPGSWHRIHPITQTRTTAIFFGVLSTVTALAFLDQPLGDTHAWFIEGRPFALPGWTFWDHAAFSIAAGFGTKVLADVLLYDLVSIEREDLLKDRRNIFGALCIAAFLAAPILLGLYRFIGLFTDSTILALCLSTLILAAINTVYSASGRARVILISLPIIYLDLAQVLALGLWKAILFSLLTLAPALIRFAILENEEGGPVPDEPSPPASNRPTASA